MAAASVYDSRAFSVISALVCDRFRDNGIISKSGIVEIGEIIFPEIVVDCNILLKCSLLLMLCFEEIVGGVCERGSADRKEAVAPLHALRPPTD